MGGINMGLVKMAETTNDINFLTVMGINSYGPASVKIAEVIANREDLPDELRDKARFHIMEMEKMEPASDYFTKMDELIDIAKDCRGGTRTAALFTIAQKDVDKFEEILDEIDISSDELKELSIKFITADYVLDKEDNVRKADVLVNTKLENYPNEQKDNSVLRKDEYIDER